MRVLFTTSEAYPLIKTGGLADVSGALPAALKKLDVDIKILIPGYPSVLKKVDQQLSLGIIQVFANVYCELIVGFMPYTEVEVIIIKNDVLYDREGSPYVTALGEDWPDNPLRFGVLSKVASLLCEANSPLNWVPDLVQCNDWQTGLTPYYLHLANNSQVKTVFGIHNLAFQGNCHPDWAYELELNTADYQLDGYEYYGHLSFLKAGVFYADQISTVSPNYAQEIQSPMFGFGMDGLLKTRSADITGIINGIDLDEWNPDNDPYLSTSYNVKDLSGKAVLKAELQQKLGLTVDASIPMLGVVSRLTYQKGLDLLIAAMPEVIALGCQVAVLGSGDKGFEDAFSAYALAHPNQVSVSIGYIEPLSHLIMAGVDIFIMPSRFEPCGLNQLYGLRYGTPPIVSNTGGLADSICNTTTTTLANHAATGFVIDSVTKLSLLGSIQQALSLWQDKKTWQALQKNGMNQEVGWENSANAYLALYEKTLQAQ